MDVEYLVGWLYHKGYMKCTPLLPMSTTNAAACTDWDMFSGTIKHSAQHLQHTTITDACLYGVPHCHFVLLYNQPPFCFYYILPRYIGFPSKQNDAIKDCPKKLKSGHFIKYINSKKFQFFWILFNSFTSYTIDFMYIICEI